MNEFRDRIFAGKVRQDALLRAKKPPLPEPSEAAENESFADFSIPREAVRSANHRDGDRHRLTDEAVQIVHEGRSQDVTLVNLSGGGAMVEGELDLKLWDRVELRLAEWSNVEAAVRWIRGNRYGLEFAHETRIETGEQELADMLRAVIARSFPDVAIAPEPQPIAQEAPAAQKQEESPEAEFREEVERELRHPLIWSGHVHCNHETISVRLRNISAGGALIECEHSLKTGSELLLDLGEAGTIFATVHWAHADAIGLRFHAPFELQRLAAARPEVAGTRWVAPDYLRDVPQGNSPWAKQWGRSDLGALRRRLNTFGKR